MCPYACSLIEKGKSEEFSPMKHTWIPEVVILQEIVSNVICPGYNHMPSALPSKAYIRRVIV